MDLPRFLSTLISIIMLKSALGKAEDNAPYSTLGSSKRNDIADSASGVHCCLGKCANYRGIVNVTVSGRRCQRWDASFPHKPSYGPSNYPQSGLEENYCRNPSNHTTTWCYTTDPSKRWEACYTKCQEECCTGKCPNYRGKKSVTKSGIQCQRWESNSPHLPFYTPESYPKSGLEENYCRNPSDHKSAWCYTTDPKTRWEACDTSCQCGKRVKDSRRIVNGDDAGHGEFPWQISLRYGKHGHICGGTLIGKQYVLSAAHCFLYSKNPARYTVRVGDWYMSKQDGTEEDFRVTKIHIHERYFASSKPFISLHDIALLKLASPVNIDSPYAGPACMPPAGKDYRGNQNCVASGWGLLQRSPNKYADRLQKVTGRIWGTKELLREWGNVYIPVNAVGFGTTSSGACKGDSGGPLVCPNGSGSYDVVGIVSFGTSKCRWKPGIFTEVSAYRGWISVKSGGAI